MQPVLTLLRWSSSTPFRANASPNRLLAIQCCGDIEWRVAEVAGGSGVVQKERPTHLLEQVPNPHGAADDETHQVLGVKLIIEQLCRHKQLQDQKNHHLVHPSDQVSSGHKTVPPLSRGHTRLTLSGLSGALSKEQLVLLVGEGFWEDSTHQGTERKKKRKVVFLSLVHLQDILTSWCETAPGSPEQRSKGTATG